MATIEAARSGHVVIGVDTHKHIHVAAVMDSIGGILATLTIATDAAGYKQLLDWARGFGKIMAFGIEGTGSYGAALTSFLRRHDHKVIEVARPDRRLRRLNGKSDALDAENARRPGRTGGIRHRSPQERRRCGRDDPAAEGRSRYSGQGQDRGDGHAQSHARPRLRRPAP